MNKLELIAHGPVAMAAAVVMLVCALYSQLMYVGWLFRKKYANRNAIKAIDYLSYLKKNNPLQAKIWVASQVIGVFLLVAIFIQMFFR